MKDPIPVIEPGIGRLLHFYPDGAREPRAAVVTKVHGTRMVNLGVFDPSGVPYGRTSVQLVQPCDPVPGHAHCRWMPFQGGQPEGIITGECVNPVTAGLDRTTSGAIGQP